MHEETIFYKSGDLDCQGFVVYDEAIQGKRPTIILAHTWMGIDDFIKDKAREIAKLGYLAFVADIFGHGGKVSSIEKAKELIGPLFVDRQQLRDRICAAYQTAANQPFANKEHMGAIGFCFGGLTVIELLRSGYQLKGIVSFHGVLGNKMQDLKAKNAPTTAKMHGAILILTGHLDPLVSDEDIKSIQKELTDAKVDWEMDIYGHAVHGFTNHSLSDVKGGLAFNEKANKRSWQRMQNFFDEVFK